MKTIYLFAAILATAALSGCDAEGDEPVSPEDITLVANACAKNGALASAERVRPMFGPREWRISCSDGARFVVTEKA